MSVAIRTHVNGIIYNLAAEVEIILGKMKPKRAGLATGKKARNLRSNFKESASNESRRNNV